VIRFFRHYFRTCYLCILMVFIVVLTSVSLSFPFFSSLYQFVVYPATPFISTHLFVGNRVT
jgi:hypothetical protein